MPAFSSALEETLHRTVAYANQQRHEYATLEHLLLALLNDPDASDVLNALDVDRAHLEERLKRYIHNDLILLTLEDDVDADAKPTAGFQRAIQRSVIHVQSAGDEIVTGANVLASLFSERDTYVEKFLADANLNRYDVVNYIAHGVGRRKDHSPPAAFVARQLESLAKSVAATAPQFAEADGLLRYEPSIAESNVTERIEEARVRCEAIELLCAHRGNEQPQLLSVVSRYGAALSRVTPTSGAYKLLLAGLDLENLFKIKASTPSDPDRNPPLDADLAFAAQSLIIAHAGLMGLYADTAQVVIELDRYRAQSESLDALRERLLEPLLHVLSEASDIFEETTREIGRNVSDIPSDIEGSSQRSLAVKHNWLRGQLAALATYLSHQVRGILLSARDATVKEGVTQAIRNHDALTGAIFNLFKSSSNAIQILAQRLPSGFGWLEPVLRFFGLVP